MKASKNKWKKKSEETDEDRKMGIKVWWRKCLLKDRQ